MAKNETFWDNLSHFQSLSAEEISAMTRNYVIAIFLSLLGTLFNLWFLVVMLTSRDLRSRLRNKIICNTLVVHLLDSAIIFPAKAALKRNDYDETWCVSSVFLNIVLIQDFIVNWLVVMLLIVFIAQIKEFNPRTRLTPKAITIGTLGLIVLPWFASIIEIIILALIFYYIRSWTHVKCFDPHLFFIEFIKTFDTFVPIILSVLLLITAAVLKYRRLTSGESSGSTEVELISSGPEIDNTFAYVAAVAVCIVCDLLLSILWVDYHIIRYKGYDLWLKLLDVAEIMNDARVILMPLTWLIFPEVRQAIRIWRPWKRSSPNNDSILLLTRREI